MYYSSLVLLVTFVLVNSKDEIATTNAVTENNSTTENSTMKNSVEKPCKTEDGEEGMCIPYDQCEQYVSNTFYMYMGGHVSLHDPCEDLIDACCPLQ